MIALCPPRIRDSKSLTAAECCRVMFGLGRVGEGEDVDTILKAIGDRTKWQRDWPRVHAAGLEALARAPGKRATDVLAERMANTSGPIKVDLLGVLGCRGPEMAEEAAVRIRAALSDTDEQVRQAAMQAIKSIEK